MLKILEDLVTLARERKKNPVEGSYTNKLLEDEKFVNKLKNRWFYLRSNLLSDQSLEELINMKYDILYNRTGAAKRNFDRWEILENYIWPNSYVGGNYYNEIEFLKNWIKNRTLWLDESINDL